MLIRREVFETLKDNHPEWKYFDDRVQNKHEDKFCYSFFDFKSTPEGYVGEDYNFCDRASEHGFEGLKMRFALTSPIRSVLDVFWGSIFAALVGS
jgi:hypothetical protein